MYTLCIHYFSLENDYDTIIGICKSYEKCMWILAHGWEGLLRKLAVAHVADYSFLQLFGMNLAIGVARTNIIELLKKR